MEVWVVLARLCFLEAADFCHDVIIKVSFPFPSFPVVFSGREDTLSNQSLSYLLAAG